MRRTIDRLLLGEVTDKNKRVHRIRRFMKRNSHRDNDVESREDSFGILMNCS